MELDVEKTIEYLNGNRGIKMKEMQERLGVDRGGFLSWRRSSNKGRREEMAKKLQEAFPEMFTEGIPAPETDASVDKKYMNLLEKSLKEAEEEKLRLKRQVDDLIEEIKKLTK